MNLIGESEDYDGEEAESAEELLVRDVMSYPVATAPPSATVREIARIMAENNVGSIVIVNDKGIVIGIITEGDIVRRVVAAGLDPAKTLAEEIMTQNPVVVYEDIPLHRAADLMASKNIGHLPVVDRAGRPIGIVAISDIARLAPELIEYLYVEQSRKALRLPSEQV